MTTETHADRLLRLREEVRAGAYVIDATAVAEAMLAYAPPAVEAPRHDGAKCKRCGHPAMVGRRICRDCHNAYGLVYRTRCRLARGVQPRGMVTV